MRKYATLHDIKLDALEDLREELGDAQLIVVYEFQSDIDRMAKRFGDIAVLSSGMPRAKRAELMAAWNSGELKTLYLHPAAAGHGLNLQGSNAHHICWFSATWNLELYEQTIARLLRQGNQSKHIVNHILAMADTIDELKIAALSDKGATQEKLLERLKAEIQPEKGDSHMAIRKLGQPREEEAAPVVRTARAADASPESGSAEHRATIREMATGGASAFSADLQAKAAALVGAPPKPGPVQNPAAAEPRAAKPAEKKAAAQVTQIAPANTGTASAVERLDAIVSMFRAALESVMRL